MLRGLPPNGGGRPEKPSRWGQLAGSGHQVVQFKDAERNKFVAVVVDGQVTFYGSSKKLP